MRTLLVLVAFFGTLLVLGPAARADEPPPPAERLQLVLGLDANDIGVGARLGMRWRWLEADVIAAGDVIDASRLALGVKLSPLPEARLSPFVYGRYGHWGRNAFYDDVDDGRYRSVGLGLDVRVGRRWVVYSEVGLQHRDGAHRLTDPGTDVELGLGLALRF